MSTSFKHSLYVDRESCKGCTRCMKQCPTSAIRIVQGIAQVDPEKCIDCGQCMAVCPHQAITIKGEQFNTIFSYTRRVAIIPSVLIGQFDEEVTEQMMIDAIYDLGFTDVFYAEFGIDILRTLGNHISVYSDSLPVISSYCPAVVRLIQLSYPSLLSHVNLVKTPSQITSMYARSALENEGVLPEEIGIFYISGCAAKVAQVLNGPSARKELMSGTLNLDTLVNMMQPLLSKPSRSDKPFAISHPLPPITSSSFLYSVTGGESAGMSGRKMAIDEIHNVIEFLDLVEDERLSPVDFLELRACDTGCTGGILTVRNRFCATERIRYSGSKHPEELPPDVAKRITERGQDLLYHLKSERLTSKPALSLDENPIKALKKLEKAHAIEQILPGLDCGLCGYPSCRVLSEEIVQGNTSIRSCSVLKMNSPETLNRLEKIWGSLPRTIRDA
ncbi:MAG: 4Fe-4S binding protein [Sphaerochaetaceae bacterium]|nr:4Fe-4S binding protein [Sphaerochaetaceae bacterium]